MIGIIMHFDKIDGLSSWVSELWKDTVKPLNGLALYVVDTLGIAPKEIDLNTKYKVFNTIEEAIDECLNATLVYVESEKSIPNNIPFTYLKDFIHPDGNVFYIFGSDAGSLKLKELPLDNNYVISIKTYNKFPLWALVAAGITLYDRKVKV